MHYRAEVSTAQQLRDSLSLSELEYVYTPVGLLSEEELDRMTEPCKSKVIVVPPVFLGDGESRIEARIKSLFSEGITHMTVHTIGHISIARDAGMSLHGSLRLNIANHSALLPYRALGLVDSVLSIECSLKRMASLVSEASQNSETYFSAGFIAYGQIPLMLLRRIPDNDKLIDRKSKHLPLLKNIKNEDGSKEAELLNPNPIVLSDRMNEFRAAGLGFAVLRMSPGESVREVMAMYQNETKPDTLFGRDKSGDVGFTRGLYYK